MASQLDALLALDTLEPLETIDAHEHPRFGGISSPRTNLSPS